MARKSRNSLFLAHNKIEEAVGRAVLFDTDRISDHGSECVYIPITSQVAVKLFETKKERDHAFLAQRYFNKQKVAPKVGKCFLLDFIQHQTVTTRPYGDDITCYSYGYTTQIAKPYPFPKNARKMYFTEYLSNKDRKRLKDAGIPMDDLHGDNIGKIGNRAVALDFGPISCPGKYGKK